MPSYHRKIFIIRSIQMVGVQLFPKLKRVNLMCSIILILIRLPEISFFLFFTGVFLSFKFDSQQTLDETAFLHALKNGILKPDSSLGSAILDSSNIPRLNFQSILCRTVYFQNILRNTLSSFSRPLRDGCSCVNIISLACVRSCGTLQRGKMRAVHHFCLRKRK